MSASLPHWTAAADRAIIPAVDDYIVTLVQTTAARSTAVKAPSAVEAARAVNQMKSDPVGACYSVVGRHRPDRPSTVQILPRRVRVMQG